MARQSKRDRTKDLAEELDVFDTMLASLVELLEEKGILTQEELENRIRRMALKAGGYKSYRDIQFPKKTNSKD